MNKITCDICMDLLPLVTDDVASEDSKNAVLEHIVECPTCRQYYEQNNKPAMDTDKVTKNIKKKLYIIAIALIVIGAAFGLAIANGSLMFYNIIVMPAIGVISYFILKRKSLYSLVCVFISVYIRWLPDTFEYLYKGHIYDALYPPLVWAIIYTGLFSLGIIIAFLLHFGFRKEKDNEKNS